MEIDTQPAPGLRVLYVINALTVGGAEIGLANLIRRGLWANLELRVVALWPPDPILLDAYPQLQPYAGTVLLANGQRGGRAYASAFGALVRLVRTWRPRVLICSLAQSVLLGRAIKLMFPRLQLITFEHNAKLRSATATRLVRATGWFSDGVWADSPATLESVLTRHGYKAGVRTAIVRLQEIGDCLDLPAPQFERSSLRLLFVGRLLEQKNVADCIRAVSIARGENIPVTLDIVGEGELMSDLRQVTHDLALDKQITFHGLRVDWTPRFAGSSYLGVLASSREGFAITALQMLALGMPLITTAAGEIRTYVQDGKTSFVLEGSTPEAIATGYARAWAARDDWGEIGAAARASASTFDAQMRLAFPDEKARTMMGAIA